MFDCAEFYANEAKVGAALTASMVPRSELFLISKVWTGSIFGGAAAVRAQVERSLKELGTDYIDMYLVHWCPPGAPVRRRVCLQPTVAQAGAWQARGGVQDARGDALGGQAAGHRAVELHH